MQGLIHDTKIIKYLVEITTTSTVLTRTCCGTAAARVISISSESAADLLLTVPTN